MTYRRTAARSALPLGTRSCVAPGVCSCSVDLASEGAGVFLAAGGFLLQSLPDSLECRRQSDVLIQPATAQNLANTAPLDCCLRVTGHPKLHHVRLPYSDCQLLRI